MKLIKGMHIYKNEKGIICIKGAKPYIWEIPEKLEKVKIRQGDIVLAKCKNTKAPVIVLNVFENDEVENKKLNYKKIIKILEKK